MTDAQTDQHTPEAPASLGLALSGGGHRATAFSLGVLMYLADEGLNRRVDVISSVSGGSILNAFVALLRSADGAKESYRSLRFGEFDRHAALFASLLAGNRRIWLATVFIALAAGAISTIVLLITSIDPKIVLASLLVLLAGLSWFVGPRSGGSLWGWWGTWLYCASLLWLLVAGLAGIEAIIPIEAVEVIWIVAFVCVWGFLLQQRHVVAQRAFERTICRPTAGAAAGARQNIPLEAMNDGLRHVFCATEMHTGQHAYFSNDFVYARGFGVGKPRGFPVAAAVQVSANFPGGFPIRAISASRFSFSLTDRFEDIVEQGIGMGRDILMPDKDIADATDWPRMRLPPRRLMLTDGGVFDNLAVDWYLERKARLSRFRMSLNWDFDPAQGQWVDGYGETHHGGTLAPFERAPEALIVADAGLAPPWKSGSRLLASAPLLGEILGLFQVTGALYANNVRERLRTLRDHIVLDLGPKERRVRTTLLPLGESVTKSLIHAGYRLANQQVHRRYGRPLLHNEGEFLSELVRGRVVKRARMQTRPIGIGDVVDMTPVPYPEEES